MTVSQPRVQTIVEWDEYTGRFDAVNAVDIRARVSGYLESVEFSDGEQVEAGDLLFVIDSRPFEITLTQALAEVEEAKTRLELAKRDVERARSLLDRGNISQESFDERLQRKSEAESELTEAEANKLRAKLDLEFIRVRAPIGGRTSESTVTAGNLVAGGSADSTLLTTIVSFDPIHFHFDTDEMSWLEYSRLNREGRNVDPIVEKVPVYLALGNEKKFRHKGYIDFVDNRIDRSSGSLRLRAIFDNHDFVFFPGLFGRVRLPRSEKYDALTLPEESIGTDQAHKFVFTVDESNRVTAKRVELGPLIDGYRVIRHGISAQDWIVINGLSRIRTGMTVTPKTTALVQDGHSAENLP